MQVTPNKSIRRASLKARWHRSYWATQAERRRVFAQGSETPEEIGSSPFLLAHRHSSFNQDGNSVDATAPKGTLARFNVES